MIRSKPAPFVAGQPVAKAAPTGTPKKPSQWIWVPYIWLLFASSRALSNWLAGGKPPSGNVALDAAGNSVDRLLMTALIALGLLVLGLRAERTKRVLARNKWVVVLFAYLVLSIIWSNFPGISFRRCIRSVGTFVMVLVALTESSPLEAVRTLLRRLYIVQIPLSVLAIKYFRGIGVTYNWNGSEEEWIGLSTDKNSLGQVAMSSGLFYLWQILQDWPQRKLKGHISKLTLDIVLLILTFWLLRGSKNSHSSTAIIGFITSGALLIAFQFIKKRAARAKRTLLGITLACALLAPFAYLVFETFDITPVEMVVEATGRDMTFTGRNLLWTDVLNDAKKNPVLGVGMGAFWVGPIGYDMYPLPNWSMVTPEWRPEQGHNGYIDVYVQLGAVGLILLVIVIGLAFAGALDDLQNDFYMGSIRLILLLGIVMNNVTETSFLRGEHGLWFLFLLVAINVPRPKNSASLRKRDLHLIHLGNDDGRTLKHDAGQAPSFQRSNDGALLLPDFAKLRTAQSGIR